MADYIRPVVFKLEEQLFGVNIELVQSIEKHVDVVPVPNSMPFINGIVNLRGEVIPVFSLKKKFAMDNASQPGENTIIISLPEVKIALEVDEVKEISDFNIDSVSDVPPIVRSEDTMYLDRVANNDGELILLLDVNKLLSVDEAAGVKKLAEDLQNG